jgi:(2Fe-2S) ferredoxin
LPGGSRGLGDVYKRQVVVVYPEGTWYSFVDNSDIDEIVESHLQNGQVVQRLVTPPNVGR